MQLHKKLISDNYHSKENPKSKQQLFIDCSHTYFYGGNTGIQRAVRNIANHVEKVGKSHGISCTPVIWTGRHFAKVEKVKPNGFLYSYQFYIRRLRAFLIQLVVV